MVRVTYITLKQSEEIIHMIGATFCIRGWVVTRRVDKSLHCPYKALPPKPNYPSAYLTFQDSLLLHEGASPGSEVPDLTQEP